MTALTPGERHFLLRRLHSLTGIVPLGAFLLFHFFENASARRGPEAFDSTVLEISKMPYIYAAEIALLIAPLLFHALYGLFIRTPSRPNVVSYPFARNWSYFFQRVSGIIAFAYISYHVWTTRVWSIFIKGAPITFSDMHEQFASPLVVALYALGILAVAFHFTNGIWSFCITWGIVVNREAQKRLALVTNFAFVALGVVGLDILSAFVTRKSFLSALGSSIFG